MNAVLWIFIALAFGFMLFTSIQDELPDELAVLKNKGTVTSVEGSPASAPGGVTVTSYQGWTIRQAPGAEELVRTLTGEANNISVKGKAPEIGILCANGKLDLRIDTRMATTGTAKTDVVVAGASAFPWNKGTGSNVFPQDPHPVLNALMRGTSASITLSYVDSGRQTFQVDTAGLKALVNRWPSNCQP